MTRSNCSWHPCAAPVKRTPEASPAHRSQESIWSIEEEVLAKDWDLARLYHFDPHRQQSPSFP